MRPDCNNCGSVVCPIPKGPAVKRLEISLDANREHNCRYWKPPEPMKTPLLLHLVRNNQMNVVSQILKEAGIRFVEKRQYPFFSLQV